MSYDPPAEVQDDPTTEKPASLNGLTLLPPAALTTRVEEMNADPVNYGGCPPDIWQKKIFNNNLFAIVSFVWVTDFLAT